MSRHRTYVKVCGVCSPEDAAAAVEAGADAVGVVLAPSPRRSTLEDAHGVFEVVPPHVDRVGVFVDPSLEDVCAAVCVLGLDLVQLHGSETPQFCAEVPARVIKAFRVGPGFDRSVVDPYVGAVFGVLYDAQVPGVAGGTGQAFGWDPALVPDDIATFVAGGLDPGNVGEAIRVMHPYAVDVSSGVERRVRVKDPERVRAFVAAVRAADEEEG